MKFQVGDIIVNKDPNNIYDSGIILKVHNKYYLTYWFINGHTLKNYDLYTMHTYLIMTDIFRDI